MYINILFQFLPEYIPATLSKRFLHETGKYMIHFVDTSLTFIENGCGTTSVNYMQGSAMAPPPALQVYNSIEKICAFAAKQDGWDFIWNKFKGAHVQERTVVDRDAKISMILNSGDD